MSIKSLKWCLAIIIAGIAIMLCILANRAGVQPLEPETAMPETTVVTTTEKPIDYKQYDIEEVYKTIDDDPSTIIDTYVDIMGIVKSYKNDGSELIVSNGAGSYDRQGYCAICNVADDDEKQEVLQLFYDVGVEVKGKVTDVVDKKIMIEVSDIIG